MNEKFTTKKINERFFNVLKYSNYKVIKCYNLVFTRYFILNNIGSNIVFVFVAILLGCFIIFIIKGTNPLKNKLELIFPNKFPLNNLNNNNIFLNLYQKIIIITKKKKVCLKL